MTYVFRSVLALIILANGVGLAVLLTSADAIGETYALFRPWMVPALALLALSSIAACIALWSWKRWGFAMLVTAYGLMLVINLGFDAPLMHVLLGPAGLVILGATYWPVRDRFSVRRRRR